MCVRVCMYVYRRMWHGPLCVRVVMAANKAAIQWQQIGILLAQPFPAHPHRTPLNLPLIWLVLRAYVIIKMSVENF